MSTRDESAPNESAPADEPHREPRAVRALWIAARVGVVAASALALSHLLGGLWPNGWFQLAGAIAVATGVPLLFHLGIRRQIHKRGGRARFAWLSLAALLNLPLLLWVGARQPAVFVDALHDDGLGALKWVARSMGATVPCGGPRPEDTEHDDAAVVPLQPIATGDGDAGDPTAPATADPGADGTGDATATAASAADPVVAALGKPIPFENASGQLLVEVSIDGHPPLPFVLDTGATHSTLNAAALATLGIPIPADAPVRTMQTAGGEADGPLVLVDHVEVGEQRRDGVAFWICEPCAIGDAVGLLGLNVWQGYLLTIDPAEQNIWIRPKEGTSNRLYDVEPFLRITSPTSRMQGDQLVVDVVLSNGSPRTIDQAVVLVTAIDDGGRELGAFTIDAAAIPGAGSTMATGTLPAAGDVAGINFQLIDARW